MATLFQAIEQQDVESVKSYIETGQSLAIKDKIGRSPLQLAIASGNSEIIQLLIEQKANFCAVDVRSTVVKSCD